MGPTCLESGALARRHNRGLAWLRGGDIRTSGRYLRAATAVGEGHGIRTGDSGDSSQCLGKDKRWTSTRVVTHGQYCDPNEYANIYARSTSVLECFERTMRHHTRNPQGHLLRNN